MEAPDGVDVQVVQRQPTGVSPDCSHLCQRGHWKSASIKEIFTDEAKLPPIFEDPDLCVADDIRSMAKVHPQSLNPPSRTIRPVGGDMASIPEITADVAEGRNLYGGL